MERVEDGIVTFESLRCKRHLRGPFHRKFNVWGGGSVGKMVQHIGRPIQRLKEERQGDIQIIYLK